MVQQTYAGLLRSVIPEMFNDLNIPINGDITVALVDKTDDELRDIVMGLLMHQQSLRKPKKPTYTEILYPPIQYSDIVWCF